MNNEPDNVHLPRISAPLGLSFTAGLGFFTMAVALAVGAIQSNDANSSTIGLAFITGLALFILGVGGWLAVVQPFKHFDNINIPQDTGHHHGDGAEEQPSHE